MLGTQNIFIQFHYLVRLYCVVFFLSNVKSLLPKSAVCLVVKKKLALLTVLLWFLNCYPIVIVTDINIGNLRRLRSQWCYAWNLYWWCLLWINQYAIEYLLHWFVDKLVICNYANNPYSDVCLCKWLIVHIIPLLRMFVTYIYMCIVQAMRWTWQRSLTYVMMMMKLK